EELNDLGAGIRVLYKDSGWGFADTDEVNPENIRDTTRKALALARGAAKIGSKALFVKEPVHVDDWVSPTKKESLAVSTDRQYVLGGYEILDELDLPGQAPTLTKEALALTQAEGCPEGKSDVILSADQVGLQVHESCGHPIELDRVLGYEANFAGRSFLTPDQ